MTNPQDAQGIAAGTFWRAPRRPVPPSRPPGLSVIGCTTGSAQKRRR